MAISPEDYLKGQVSDFEATTTAFLSALTRRAYPSESRALEVFTKVQTEYLAAHQKIQDHLYTFNDGSDGILEDKIAPYLETTQIFDRLCSIFSQSAEALAKQYPTLDPSIIVHPLRDHTPKTLLFYYAGKGDLYLRGEGLSSLDPRGRPIPLSWDIEVPPIPLTPIADNLWQATVYVPPGAEGKYKVINNADWSAGPDTALDSTTQTKLQTPSFGAVRSLCLPIKINNPEYKVCIYGEGRVRLPTGEIRELHWDAPLEMERMGSALFRADLEPIGDVQYKFCLVGRAAAGEIIWEKGGNRTLRAGETALTLPSFDLPAGIEVQELGPAQIAKEPLPRLGVEERMLAERMRDEAMKSGAARPKAVHSDTIFFEPSEILIHHDFTEIAPLDGGSFGGAGAIPVGTIAKHRAADGRWVIFQQGATGCSAGASAFLMLDIGVMPDVKALRSRTTSNVYTIVNDLTAKRIPIVQTRTVPTTGLKGLSDMILAHGPAAVRIAFGGRVGHFIIVDDISPDLSKVRIRDPWHGWDITVTASSFLRYWLRSLEDGEHSGYKNLAIQINKGVAR